MQPDVNIPIPLSPEEVLAKIKLETENNLKRERKGLALNKIVSTYNQFIEVHVIKKRVNPPYMFKVLVSYHDISQEEINKTMVSFAKHLEKAGWKVITKCEKPNTSTVANLQVDLRIKLTEDQNLLSKELLYHFHLYHKKPLPTENKLDKILYRSISKSVLRQPTKPQT